MIIFQHLSLTEEVSSAWLAGFRSHLSSSLTKKLGGGHPWLAPLPTSVHWPCGIVAADVCPVLYNTRPRVLSTASSVFDVYWEIVYASGDDFTKTS